MAIDLTDRYHSPEYQRAGIDWTLNRVDEPAVAAMVHHTAGWYVRKLGIDASAEDELAEIDALAADHFNRFGIGPGYYYVAFPSSRLYAVGKYGTHRAHTRGKNPATQNWWNREALAVVAAGNYQTDPVPPTLWSAVESAIDEMRAIAGQEIAIYPHGGVPGNPTQTSCPGQHLERRLMEYLDNGTERQQVIAGLRNAQVEIARAIHYLEGE